MSNTTKQTFMGMDHETIYTLFNLAMIIAWSMSVMYDYLHHQWTWFGIGIIFIVFHINQIFNIVKGWW